MLIRFLEALLCLGAGQDAISYPGDRNHRRVASLGYQSESATTNGGTHHDHGVVTLGRVGQARSHAAIISVSIRLKHVSNCMTD